MKFYGREKEIETLQKIENLSASYAQMIVIIGRRCIVSDIAKDIPAK